MDFSLDEEQQALGGAVRGLLKAYGDDVEHRRQVVAQDPGFDEDTWRRLGEMGVLGLPFAEDDGGMGAGPVEVSVVAEELGRVLAPEPFLEVVVLAGGLVAAVGTPQQRGEILGGLSEGSTFPVLAYDEPKGRWTMAAGGVAATSDGDSWRLNGVKEPVADAARADVLLVTAPVEERIGVFVVDPADAEVSSYAAYDGGRAGRVRLRDTPAAMLGEGPVDDATLSLVVARAQVAACHEMVGAMEAAMRLTTSYLTTRKQFGVTLNKFQALTFRAADMYTSLELARSITTWATMVLDADETGEIHPVAAAARAKLMTGKAARHIAQEAIQLHGGIGMTDEYAVGHYSARLTALEHFLGDGRAQTGVLRGHLEDHAVVDALP